MNDDLDPRAAALSGAGPPGRSGPLLGGALLQFAGLPRPRQEPAALSIEAIALLTAAAAVPAMVPRIGAPRGRRA